MSRERALRLAWVLWPSFLVAAAAEFAFFAVFDPIDLHPFGVPIDADRLPLYTAFFFFFWLIGAAASALTLLLQRSPLEVNRCPLKRQSRPADCSRRPHDAVS
ncbi:MAG: hypothetical protein RMK97_03490 [Sutterellaceae bacterium]|nr:hypothetical protein [Burkholderiaceae bacterium]MDW8429555.1 hypothetical protein [Sutterellaceae bacterium]